MLSARRYDDLSKLFIGPCVLSYNWFFFFSSVSLTEESVWPLPK